MSRFDTLDHLRAKAAADAILENEPLKSAKSRADKKLKNYRSVIRNAPTYVRQVGLLQSLAFWMSKDRDAEKLVVEHLMNWLTGGNSPSTEHVCRSGAQPKKLRFNENNPSDCIPSLLDRSSTQIAALEAEAEAYLGWLSRVAEGLYVSLPEK